MGNVLSKNSVADSVQAWYRAKKHSLRGLQPEICEVELGSLIPLYRNPAAEDILLESATECLSKSWIELCEKNDISVQRSQYAHDLVFAYLMAFAKEVPKDPRELMWILEDECKNPWKSLLHMITRYHKETTPSTKAVMMWNSLLQASRKEAFNFCGYCQIPFADKIVGKKCSRCKMRYCNRNCQQLHWPDHRHACFAD